METTTQRIYDAAVAVLGSVMLDPTVSGDVFAKVRAEHFIMPEYRTVFEAEQTLFLAGKPIDPVAVTALIGEAYRPLIMDIMDLTPTAANCMAYVDILIEQTRLHQLRELGGRLANAATLDDATDLLAHGQGLCANSSTVPDRWIYWVHGASESATALSEFWHGRSGQPPFCRAW